LISSQKWERLMTDDYYESNEILVVLRRYRPKWIKIFPNKKKFQQLKSDWTKPVQMVNGSPVNGFWTRLRTEPREEAATVRRLQLPLLTAARRETEVMRRQKLVIEKVCGRDALTNARITLEPRPEWIVGTEGAIERWRWKCSQTLFNQIHRTVLSQHEFDWLSPFVKLNRILEAKNDWDRLWCNEIKKCEVPTAWLRTIGSIAQESMKWTRGTPGDNQIVAMLPRTDVIATTDRALVRLIAVLANDAPCKIGRGELVKDGGKTRESLHELLQQLGKQRSKL
ncbi:MAG TPA: hypothetical protein VMN36_00615, partial [Verrucomicrobiales bacterium]|nr:hypothetical protein [Verrucomicrobiales bacterium]